MDPLFSCVEVDVGLSSLVCRDGWEGHSSVMCVGMGGWGTVVSCV